MSEVFVCLATYEPDLALLDRQLRSLSAQSHRAWTGVVVDDASSCAADIARRVAEEPRLVFHAHDERVGFYRNFERGLALAPAQVPYVALCDQDDHWHPDRLSRGLTVLEQAPQARLAYSDLRLVDRRGHELAPSFWMARPHGRTFRAHLYNNVVTGSTTLFRRALLELALPFPNDPGGAFHDHWLALCAEASGGLAYVDEALVDYTQHERNVIGAEAMAAPGLVGELQLALGIAREAWSSPDALVARLDRLGAHAARTRAKLARFARALHERVPAPSSEIARALRPFLHDDARGLLDLAGPTLLGSRLVGEPTNLEPLKIPLGLLWRRLRGGRGAGMLP